MIHNYFFVVSFFRGEQTRNFPKIIQPSSFAEREIPIELQKKCFIKLLEAL